MADRDASAVPVLAARDVTYRYPGSAGGRWRQSSEGVLAVDHVSFELMTRETLAVVGESGSGKSTLAYCVLRLLQPEGQILFDGTDLSQLSIRQLRPIRRHLQIVFQDPFSSLNPRMSIREILAEPLRIHGEYARGSTSEDRLRATLEHVSLAPASLDRYPHEFSGGQRQRIAIARALILQPRVLICDEPVSSLDVSIQAQIINLLLTLQEEFDLSYLFISHDLAVVSSIAHRVVIMRRGQLIETGSTTEIFAHPKQEYTRALIAAAPDVDSAIEARRRSTHA